MSPSFVYSGIHDKYGLETVCVFIGPRSHPLREFWVNSEKPSDLIGCFRSDAPAHWPGIFYTRFYQQNCDIQLKLFLASNQYPLFYMPASFLEFLSSSFTKIGLKPLPVHQFQWVRRWPRVTREHIIDHV